MRGWIFYSFSLLKCHFVLFVSPPLHYIDSIFKGPRHLLGFFVDNMLITFFKKNLEYTKTRRTFDLSNQNGEQRTEQKQL